MDDQEFYTVKEAAKVLQRDVRTVRRLLNKGELTGENVEGAWRVDKASVHERMESLRRAEAPAGAFEDRLEDLALRLGRAEGQRELVDASQANLQSERDQLRQALNEEMEKRIRAEAELELIRAQDEIAQPKGWLRTFFGM